MAWYVIYACENDSIRIEPHTKDERVRPLGDNWDDGVTISVPVDVEFKVYLKKYKSYDWIGGYSWMPYVNGAVQSRLEPVLGDHVQWLGPIMHDKQKYFMLNSTRIIDCASTDSSWSRMLLDQELIKDEWLFRAKGFTRKLIASERFKRLILKAGDTGIRFGRIHEDGTFESFEQAETASQE